MKTKGKIEITICILTVCLLFVLLISHTYNDLVATTRHGINFWNILKDGKFLEFYEVNRMASGNIFYAKVQGCAYNILVYIVFAIWNLPLYFLERFAGVDVMNAIPCLVYSKLLVVVCTAVTMYILKKILEEFELPKEHLLLTLYLYVSSTLLVSVIFITGQYDILSVIFQLLGFLAFLKGKNRAFILWFGISFCFKFFAVVIFLPLLLLRDKKVFSWIRSLIVMLIPWVLTRIPFWIYGIVAGSARTLASGGEAAAGKFMTNMLTSCNITNGINLFVIVYAAILVWCYLQDSTSKKSGHQGVWACMLAYASFFGLMKAYPYWSIMLAPFVTLAIAMAPQHIYLNTILETMGYAGLVGVNMLRYNWVYLGDTLEPMVWSRILVGTGYDTDFTGSLLKQVICGLYSHTEIHAIINSVFLGAIAALAFTTYPGKNGDVPQKLPDPKDFRDVLLVRFLVNSFICLIPIIAIFI